MSDKETKYIFNDTKCIVFKRSRHQQQKRFLRDTVGSQKLSPTFLCWGLYRLFWYVTDLVFHTWDPEKHLFAAFILH